MSFGYFIGKFEFYVNITEKTRNKTVNNTAKSNIHNEVMSGKLLFILPNGVEINAAYAADGIWWAVYTFDEPGDYIVNASYVGLDNVTITNATISISRVNSTVNITDVVLNYGVSKNITVTTEGAIGITAKIGDENATVMGNTIVIPILDVGTYVLTVTTIADVDHISITKNARIIVNKCKTELTADAINTTFNANDDLVIALKDGKGALLSNQLLFVDLNGVKMFITDSNGQVKVPTHGLPADTYVARIVFLGSDNYKGSNAEATVTINKDDTLLSAEANVTVVVDGVEYPARVVDGKVVIDTNRTEPEIPSAVVVDGVEYPIEIVNGTATINTNRTEPAIQKAAEFSDIVIGDDQSISFTLKDEDGKAIAGAKITYSVNGKSQNITTDKEGKFIIKAENGAQIVIGYEGDDKIIGTNTALKLNNPAVPGVVSLATRFGIDKDASVNSITITGYAVDTPAGEEGMTYSTVLQDENGKLLGNVPIYFAVNNKIYDRTTYANGSFEPYHLNMIRAGRYTMAFYYAGDETHESCLACVCVDLAKKPITIKASAKTFKTSQKTEKYTVTLKTTKGSSADGKVYLKSE